jgi:hypothetical protein
LSWPWRVTSSWAADDVRFRQLEVGRGILPFGGATFRAPAQLGWGNAMRFLLTAGEFGADQALRIGLVQEIVPAGQQLQRATAIARAVAAQAPLGVQGTLANARAWHADAERGRRRAPARATAGGARKRGRRCGAAQLHRAPRRPLHRPMTLVGAATGSGEPRSVTGGGPILAVAVGEDRDLNEHARHKRRATVVRTGRGSSKWRW